MDKSDALEAHRIATAVLPVSVDNLGRARLHDGVRQAAPFLEETGFSPTYAAKCLAA